MSIIWGSTPPVNMHGEKFHIGDTVVDSHGHTFVIKGRGASFKGHGIVRVALAHELRLVSVGARTIVWGGDGDPSSAAFAAGADGDTIMWGT